MAALLLNAHSEHNTSIDPITYIQQTHRVRRAADARVQTPEVPNSSSRRTMSPLGINIGGASFSVKKFLRRKRGNTNTGNSNSNSEHPQSTPGSRPLAMQSFMIVRDNSGADLSEFSEAPAQDSDSDRPAEAHWCPSYSYPSYPSPLLSPSQCQSPIREVVSPMMSSTSLRPVLQATALVQPTMTPAATTPASMTSFSQTMKAHFTRDRSRSRSLSMSASDPSPSSTPSPSSGHTTSSRQSRKGRHRAVVLVDADFANYYNTDPADWTWSNSNHSAASDNDNAKNTSDAPPNTGTVVARKQLNRRSLSADCLPKVTQERIQTYQDTRGVAMADTGNIQTYAFRDRSEQHDQNIKGRISRLHMELVSDPDEGHDDQDMDVGNCSMSSGEILAWMPEATDMPSDSLCGIAGTFRSRLRAEEAEEQKQRDAYRSSVALLTAEILKQTGSTLSRSDSNSSNVSCSTAASSDASTVIHDQDVLETNIQVLRRNKSKRRDAVRCVDDQEPTTISSAENNQQDEHTQERMACGDQIYLVSSDPSPTHFYDSPQVREALRLFLASNGCEFEDMIDNGFPSEVLLNSNDDEDDEDREDEIEDDESVPDRCRYLTLRITLTPWHSRADEADLYGPEGEPEASQEFKSGMSELFSREQGDHRTTNPSPSIDLATPSKVPSDAFTRSDSAFSSATTALDGRSSSGSVNTSRNSSRNSSLKRESKSGMKPHLASLPVNIVTRGDLLDSGHETSSPCPSSLSSSVSSSSSSTPASSPCASPTISPSMGPRRKRSSSAVFYFPAVGYISETAPSDDQESDLASSPINSLPRPLLARHMSEQSSVKSEDSTSTHHLYSTRPQSTQARRSRRYPYHVHIQQQGPTEDDENFSSSPLVGRAPNSAGSRPRPLSPSSSGNNESDEIKIYECYHISNLDRLYKADGNEPRIDMHRSDMTSKPQQLHFDKPVMMSLSRQGTRLFQAQSRRGADVHRQTKDPTVASVPPPLSAKSLRRREVGRRQAIVPASDNNASPPASTRSQRSQSPMEEEFVSTADLSWEVYSIYSKGRGNQDLSPIIYGHEEIAAHTDGCWRPVPCRLAPETKMFSFP
ncbi:hypothetical protein EC968_002881 [Mortierella alpina]|nr:hypothetical protein EC968_002881 [Mortierella alpina]